MIENCFQDKSNYNDEVYLYYPKEVILDVNVIYIEESPAGPDTGSQVIVLIYDITEIRRLEKVRTDFISNASHELKTPITSIQGFAETLLDGALEDPDLAQEFVGIIASESNRLTSLISDILDLSKIEQDQIGHKVESIDLEVLANGALVKAEELALRKGISLHTVNLHEEPIIFNSEAGRIDQILTNLVNNGIKYTNPGGDVWIILDLMEAEGYVHISVKDNGVGIPREDLPRIFERFYRVSKDRSTNSGGTGLGLSIVRNLVNSMNGKIHVESQYGQGSCFNVYLPMLDLEDNDDGIEILEE
ncbi:sensor histidine kinase [Aerococcus sanguinicola]|nr:ATP-binding protein [Aerococcus sanguinicola]